MYRFLATTSFALMLLAGSLSGGTTVAHAQTPVNGSLCDYTDAGTQDGIWKDGHCVSNGTYGFANTSANTAANVAANAAAASSNQSTGKSVATDLKTTADDTYNGIMIKIMSLFAWLVGVAAITLDYAVYYTVIKMGDFVNHLSAIGVTWKILRDIGNIMLIFGFLAIGITTILNVEWYGGGKKMLPMLLIAAVFLNFSLFITEAVIDTGNLFATQFYTQINGGNPAGLKSFDPGSISVSNEGISNKIMSQLGMQTIYGEATRNTLVFKGANPWFIGFLGILLFIVTAFVMFSLAFILIARFVILIFLIILAPVGFAGLAVPKLAGTAKQWWDTLFEQTITAPVLFLMLYVALAVITDVNFLTGFGSGPGAEWSGFTNGNLAGFASLMISFLVAMGLLLAVTVFAKKLSAFGAGTVSNFGNTLVSGATKHLVMNPTRFAGRQTANLARWGVKQTGGRLATNLAQQVRTSETFKNTQLGRVAATTLDKGAKGFKELEKDTAKKHEEYIKSVGEALEAERLPEVAAAQKARAAAEAAAKEAKPIIDARTAEHEAAKKQAQPLLDEVKRLEEIIRTKPEIDADRIEAEKNIPSARTRASTAEAKIKETGDKVAAANAPLIAAINEEKKITDTLAATKKRATLAYTENIQKPVTAINPVSWARWVASGTHSNAAANKIIKDATRKESDDAKLLKMVKDAAKKAADEASATSAPASAPAAKP